MSLPITVSDRHAKFMEKARRLNRTKLFLGTVDKAAKTKLAGEIAEADRKALNMEGMSGSTQLSINRTSMRDIDLNQGVQRDGMLSRELRDFKRRAEERAVREDKRNDAIHTSDGKYATDARKMFISKSYYDDGGGDLQNFGADNDDINRRSLNSRSIIAHEHSKHAHNVDIESYFDSIQLSRTHKEERGQLDSRTLKYHDEQQEKLKEQMINPDHEYFERLKREEESQKRIQQKTMKTEKGVKGRRNKRGYEDNSIAMDFYSAGNPLPMNFTQQHLLNPTLQRNHGRDYEENMGAALADSVLKDVREKYSVSAVRSMYRRRRETEEQEGRAEFNRNKEKLKPNKKTLEWKKTRVDEMRKRRVGKTSDLVKVEEDEQADTGGEEETVRVKNVHLITSLTMKKLSTDPYYKVEKENEARDKLKAGIDVILRSNNIENGGTATDSRLALQFLASGLFREIEGGVIPPAEEIVNDGVPSGEWQMLLEAKEGAESENKIKLMKYECVLPKFNNDGNHIPRASTAYI